MTIEAKLDRTNELLAQLLAKFDHIGAAQAPAQDAKAGATSAPAAEKPAPKAAKAASAAAPQAATLDYDRDVKPVAVALMAKKGKDALAAVLATFDAASARDLASEKYGAFIEALKAAGA